MMSKDLEKKLAGKKILWRPTFIDVSGTKQYEDLLVGDRKKGFVPDIWVRTEDRLPESVIPADGTELTSDDENAKIRRVRIEHVREYSRLDGFTGVLHMPTDQARGHIEPDLGRVVECRVTCDTRDRGIITRTVIWVQRDIYAESKGFSRRERKGSCRAVDLPQVSDEVGEELIEAVRLVEGAQRQQRLRSLQRPEHS